MALLTVAQIRAHVETDLSDDALGRLVDDADAEIVVAAGALASQTEEVTNTELSTRLCLGRRASVITEVVETVDDTDTTLVATDYHLREGGLFVDRLATGTNPRTTWGNSVVIEYTPVDHTVRRKRVLIDLVRLACQYNALASESSGNYSAAQRDYERERDKLLGRLREGLSIL